MSGRPSSARASALLGVCVVLIAVLAIPSKQWITQRARIASLEQRLSATQQRVEELTESQARWSDPAYVEAQARSRLHFVRPGEVGYVLLTDEGTDQSEQAPVLAEVPAGGPWWSAVWSTVNKVAQPGGPDTPVAPDPAEPAPAYEP